MLRGRLLRLLRSKWCFPLCLILATGALTCAGISGTSIGIYRSTLYGAQEADPALLYGRPRSIRSDEWLVWTQLTIAQSRGGYPAVSANMVPGQDLGLESEVPSRDWSTLLKPQLWPFFVLPVKYAFALKWWLLLASLMAASYFLVLRICRPALPVAVLLAVGFGFSPFTVWWYQSSVFLLPAYGFVLIILAARLINREPIPHVSSPRIADAVYVLAIAAVGSAFGLLFYPPFQIPIAAVVLLFAVALLLEARQRSGGGLRFLVGRVGALAVSVVAVVVVGCAFVLTHRTPLHALAESVYPGQRRITSGSGSALRILDGFVMPLEQDDERAQHFFANQSEASNFVLLMPFLWLPACLLLVRERRLTGRVDWPFWTVQALSALFLVRVLAPVGDRFFALLLLDRVPNGRLVLVLGFLGLLQLLFVMRSVRRLRGAGDRVRLLALGTGTGTFAVLVSTGISIRRHYPEFLDSRLLLLALAAAFAAIVASLLADRRIPAAALFAAFALASTYAVHPLYRGLGAPLYGRAAAAIDSVSPPSSTWVTVGRDAAAFENLGLLAGRRSLSGVRIYPDVDFWRRAAGPGYRAIYNREGHVLFADPAEQRQAFSLPQPNVFSVRFACTSFVRRNAQFALSVHRLHDRCTRLLREVRYPATTFYLYEIR